MAEPRPNAATVGRKISEGSVARVSGTPSSVDPWREFRQVEVIDFRLDFRFRHSLGKCSRFFLELERRRLFATRCPLCGTVWLPPRAVCGDDQAVTEWVELPPQGALVASTVCAYTLHGPLAKAAGDAPLDRADEPPRHLATPLVLGYVAVDTASTLLLQQIRNFGDDPARLRPGLRVKVGWAEGPVGHPMELFWFEPVG